MGRCVLSINLYSNEDTQNYKVNVKKRGKM